MGVAAPQAIGVKSSVTGPNLMGNCYLENQFHKIIRVNPPKLEGLNDK